MIKLFDVKQFFKKYEKCFKYGSDLKSTMLKPQKLFF